MAPGKILCVSIHDVAPVTWAACERLLRRVHEVAHIPVTLLVVPDYHRGGAGPCLPYEDALGVRLARGDELALHGYVHLDEGPPPRSAWERWKREGYTLREGEFAAISEREARERLERGIAWFGERGWPLDGFVPPAWLLGRGAWRALRACPFRYTTTRRRFYRLRDGSAVTSPSLVYSARSERLARLSCRGNSALARLLEQAPLVRLALHPRDAEDTMVVEHFQHLIERLLKTRTALTKAGYARLAPAAAAGAGQRMSVAAGTRTP